MAWNNGGPDGSNGPPNPWGTPPGENGRDRPGERAPGDRGPGERGAGDGSPGGPRGRGPWGGGGPGPGGVPDLDAMIERAQAWLRGILPPGLGGSGGGPGGRRGGPGGRRFSGTQGVLVLVAVVAVIWIATGFYRVEPDQQGVVLRFGAFVRTTLPGLNYHLPWPIESVETPAVTTINRVEVGYRSAGSQRVEDGQDVTSGRNVQEESLMLTGDENIIDIDFAVFWRINNAPKYLFDTRDPDGTVRAVSESVMREVIGSTPIQPALTNARAKIEASVRSGVQAVLDQYGTGVEITQVQLQKVDPPAEVIESFRDVQRANTDAERARNEADAYRNDIVPRARGAAAAIVAGADAQRQAAIAKATGQSQGFLSVLKAYDAAKDVTLQRLYIETMQDVLIHTPVTVVDDRLRGIVPFLPLGGPAGGTTGGPTGGATGERAPAGAK